MSGSQLSMEQHKDPDISALDEKEMSQLQGCYYVKNGMLMRKWHPPDAWISRRRVDC